MAAPAHHLAAQAEQNAIRQAREDMSPLERRIEQLERVVAEVVAERAKHALPPMPVLTLEQRLKAAVWMVGNMDTPEDKRSWWHDFGALFKEVASDPDVQRYADEMAQRAPPR